MSRLVYRGLDSLSMYPHGFHATFSKIGKRKFEQACNQYNRKVYHRYVLDDANTHQKLDMHCRRNHGVVNRFLQVFSKHLYVVLVSSLDCPAFKKKPSKWSCNSHAASRG